MTDYSDWSTLVGFAGMACIIGAYAYLTWNDDPNPFILHVTNLTGAALLTVSLCHHMNLPSLVLEGFWASIAIYGLVRAVLRRSRSPSCLRERQGVGREATTVASPPPTPPASGRGVQ